MKKAIETLTSEKEELKQQREYWLNQRQKSEEELGKIISNIGEINQALKVLGDEQ